MRGIKVLLASLAVVALMGFFVPALAQEGSSDDPPRVQPNVLNKDDVLGSAEDNSVLPFTGAQMTLFVVVGFAAIGLGATALRVAKTRRSDTQQA
ncbi:MAG: hypothetical protein M3124_09390 [Actinomycetota bacterium]|nr:hypothetical protein [Actinomycetota bacterium]